MDQRIVSLETPLTDAFRWNLLQKRAQEVKLRRAFDLFRQSGIEPILIKGWAAGIYYPDSEPRVSIDMDLAVSGEDYRASCSIAMASAHEGLAIDVHRELRHLDTFSFDDLYRNSITVDIDGCPIRILRPEDHLRVLCVHWLTDGGENRERLWDIYYLVENRDPQFDWNRFLGQVSIVRRRWFVCTLGLASRYLGLDLSDTPVAEEAMDLPLWLTKTVEQTWAKGKAHIPLEVAIYSPSVLADQLTRIVRPNPIASTIAVEGSFDAGTRIHYQIRSYIRRIKPTLGRISTSIRERNR